MTREEENEVILKNMMDVMQVMLSMMVLIADKTYPEKIESPNDDGYLICVTLMVIAKALGIRAPRSTIKECLERHIDIHAEKKKS